MKFAQVIPFLLRGEKITCSGYRFNTYIFIDEKDDSIKISTKEGISDYTISKVDLSINTWQIFSEHILNCVICGKQPDVYTMDDGLHVIQCQNIDNEKPQHYMSIANYNKANAISTWNKLMRVK